MSGMFKNGSQCFSSAGYFIFIINYIPFSFCNSHEIITIIIIKKIMGGQYVCESHPLSSGQICWRPSEAEVQPEFTVFCHHKHPGSLVSMCHSNVAERWRAARIQPSVFWGQTPSLTATEGLSVSVCVCVSCLRCILETSPIQLSSDVL